VGYWRVLTEYEDEEEFDQVQVLRIRSVRNPMGVAIDPDAKEPSGADANWGMIFEDEKNENLEDEYEKYKDQIGAGNAVLQCWDRLKLAERDAYAGSGVVRAAVVSGSDDPVLQRAEPAHHGLSQRLADRDQAEAARQHQHPAAPVTRSKIVWYKIFGNAIVDYRETPGKKYIPIVRVVGQETIIDGVLDRKGMVRT
jgi:hypothetical protein